MGELVSLNKFATKERDDMMEERSLRIYNSEKTFFSKITTTISKLLIPTKIGLNSMIISMKRNNVLKAFENLNSDRKSVV